MSAPSDTTAGGGNQQGENNTADQEKLRDLMDKFAGLAADAEQEVQDGDGDGEEEGEQVQDKDELVDSHAATASSSSKKKKKKKSKTASAALAKLKDLTSSSTSNNLPPDLVNQIQSQLTVDDQPPMNEAEIRKALKAVDLMKILQGQQALGNASNTKDLGEHRFWRTQPVIQTVETSTSTSSSITAVPASQEEEGPIDPPRLPSSVRTEPLPLPNGYEWSTLSPVSPAHLGEIQALLEENYVEDPDASFRLGYTTEFMRWALGPPGWEGEWCVGVRVKAKEGKEGRLVAFISGIPMDVKVRNSTFRAAEINFLCAHKKLRNKRLAPVLIKEITRRVNLKGIWQAVYTAGVVIPTPISTCRYYHRNLNPAKLVDIGFTPLSRSETISKLVRRYALPAETALHGFREMEERDVAAVWRLLGGFMKRYEMSQVFGTEEEVRHWFFGARGVGEVKGGRREGQVVWSYVVEDPTTHAITDFISFYSLPSLIMKHPTHKSLETAYAFYYATDVIGFPKEEAGNGSGRDTEADKEVLARRLNALMRDCLIVAKKAGFDVFNALSLMDNNLFLQEQMFGPGDGYLVRLPPIHVGDFAYTNPLSSSPARTTFVTDRTCAPIEGAGSGWKTKDTSKIGVVML
ncbi:hypothetical protein QFC22_003499 [Naganishia vaughanmartiniae]|uniref:Uncharacterized protein n=1 Tax=Naganishia vaughanmartiniae TaxID=1424756 RepID=A0ACC2X6K7_9TREE|nr:hypothetical protein QFC22_003499 [Naganishia vaughanmartiniae]